MPCDLLALGELGNTARLGAWRLFPWCSEWEGELRRLFSAYVEAKQKQNVLDYDDLLLYWAQMMTETSIAEDIAGRFDHVLIDEYQDTNKLQASILLLSSRRPRPDGGRRRCPIYLFLPGGECSQHSRFPDHFTPKAELITLEQNYRSTQPILAAANAVIDLAKPNVLPRTSGPTVGRPTFPRGSTLLTTCAGELHRRNNPG